MAMHNGARCFIGLDVGGTAIKAGVVTEDGHVAHHIAVNHDTADVQIFGVIEQVVTQLISYSRSNLGATVQGIGIAAPGRVDQASGVILRAGNLKLSQFPLKQKMLERFQMPTTVMNDTNAAAVGEYIHGHVASDNFMCITLGTGVGAGIILDGRLYVGNSFRAGEIGHIVLNPHGPLCACGNKGCLETFASGSHMIKKYISLLQNKGMPLPQKVSVTDIVNSANCGDSLALHILREACDALGLSIANAAALIDIDTVVLSGGVSKMNWPFVQNVSDAARKYSFRPTPIAIVKSKLIDYAAVIGVTACWLDDVRVVNFGEAESNVSNLSTPGGENESSR